MCFDITDANSEAQEGGGRDLVLFGLRDDPPNLPQWCRVHIPINKAFKIDKKVAQSYVGKTINMTIA